MSTIIFPCPFCGHDDVEIDEPQPHRYAIGCPECECIGPFGDTVGEAIEKWNRPHNMSLKIDRLVREARDGLSA